MPHHRRACARSFRALTRALHLQPRRAVLVRGVTLTPAGVARSGRSGPTPRPPPLCGAPSAPATRRRSRPCSTPTTRPLMSARPTAAARCGAFARHAAVLPPPHRVRLPATVCSPPRSLPRATRWAYEHKNEEAIELLQAAGIDEAAKDRGRCNQPFISPRPPLHPYPPRTKPTPQRTSLTFRAVQLLSCLQTVRRRPRSAPQPPAS